MDILGDNIKLRSFKAIDAQILAELCNNKNIWNNLKDYIPFPYTENDAIGFINHCNKENPQVTFAIEFNEQFVGCIGLVLLNDIYKLNAELGFWIGEKYWGSGLTTKAVNLISKYAFEHLGLVRIFSGVFEYNKASQRVLEKNNFKLECISEKSILKNKKIYDEYKYSLLNVTQIIKA